MDRSAGQQAPRARTLQAKRLGHHAVNRASHYAHSQLNKLQPIERHGMMGSIGQAIYDVSPMREAIVGINTEEE